MKKTNISKRISTVYQYSNVDCQYGPIWYDAINRKTWPKVLKGCTETTDMVYVRTADGKVHYAYGQRIRTGRQEHIRWWIYPDGLQSRETCYDPKASKDLIVQWAAMLPLESIV